MATALKSGLPLLPDRMAGLPVDARGYPVPWFVAFVDGVPDFRVVRPGGVADAYNKKICWLCGQPLGAYKSFVIGPMCTVNRISAEPPSHRDCAVFAAQACPFLTQPKMVRNDKRPMPSGARSPAGVMIMRNPGVTCCWTTRDFRVIRADGGALFKIGEPTGIQWFARGREATRAEVEDSIFTGLPALSEIAAQEGPNAQDELQRSLERVTDNYLPVN